MPHIITRPKNDKQPITITVDNVTDHTDAAIRVLVAGDQDFWIPRSLFLPGTEVESRGDEGLLILPAWFVAKEEIPVD